jgi:hypothetical protein
MFGSERLVRDELGNSPSDQRGEGPPWYGVRDLCA